MGKVMTLSALIAMLLPLPSSAMNFDQGIQIPAQFAVKKMDSRLVRHMSNSSHVDGEGVAEMLELVTQKCVMDTCRADNVLRQMRVLTQVPESTWAMSAEAIAEILEHSDAGVYDHDDTGTHTTWKGYGMTTSAGPHRFVLRSIPSACWGKFGRKEVEEIVENLTRQADRILAISLWMDAHQQAP